MLFFILITSFFVGCSSTEKNTVEKNSDGQLMVQNFEEMEVETPIESDSKKLPQELMEELGYVIPNRENYIGDNEFLPDRIGDKLFVEGIVQKVYLRGKGAYWLYIQDNTGEYWGIGLAPKYAFQEEIIQGLKGRSVCINGEYAGYSTNVGIPCIRSLWKEESDMYFLDTTEPSLLEKETIYHSHGLDYYRETYNFDVRFLSFQENYDFYKRAIKLGQYEELYDYVNAYINENTLEQTADAYKIVEILQPYIDNKDCYDIKYDDMEEECIIMYRGINTIDKQYHIFPYLQNASSLKINLGFKAQDWIFFDKIVVANENEGNDYIIIKKGDKIEEVVSGGIYEKTEIGSGTKEKEFREAILNSNKIRFENEDKEKKIDFDILEEEKRAIAELLKLENMGQRLESVLEYSSIQFID